MLVRNPTAVFAKFISAPDRMLKPIKQLTFTGWKCNKIQCFGSLQFNSSQIDAPATVNYLESFNFSQHLLCSFFADVLPGGSGAFIHPCSSQGWKGSWATHTSAAAVFMMFVHPEVPAVLGIALRGAHRDYHPGGNVSVRMEGRL